MSSTLPDPSPEQAEALLRSERFRRLAGELRCLVCQNQTLADSSAELAGDLRQEVLRQMASGKDDAAIKSHLVDRFGEFVLYRPTLNAHNIGLWAGPAVLAALGGLAMWRFTRRRALSKPKLDFEQVDALLEQADTAAREAQPKEAGADTGQRNRPRTPG
jgi:cytochrome c-type biogenesis protein CcmH